MVLGKTDKELYNLCLNTNAIREGIKNSSITTIFLTSGFGKNNAAKLFVDNFKIRYKDNFNDTQKSFIIPKEVFGREINAIILLSPSGDAYRGIAGSPGYKEKKLLLQFREQVLQTYIIQPITQTTASLHLLH
tara:strand:- start:593 stop:991 length:399 start_codon:yes stop_codon:yes gene_type:complete